jgi:hypothetical protein
LDGACAHVVGGATATAARATLDRGVRKRGTDWWAPLERERETAQWARPN